MKHFPIFGFGALVLTTLFACSVDRHEQASKASSDHQLAAILIKASSGGAIGDTWYELNVNEQIYPQDLKHPVLIASQCEPPSVSWVNDRTIQVNYRPPCNISKFNNIWYKPSDLAHGTAVPVEIILVRDEPEKHSDSGAYNH